MHHSKKKKTFNLTFNPFFKFQNLQFCNQENFYKKKSDMYLMKIQINFESLKKSNLYLMKIYISFESLKKSYLHLMKIQINFLS